MYRIAVTDLRRIGRDKKTGKPRYNARILIYDEITNKRVVDTARRIVAANDGEAADIAQREAEALTPGRDGTRSPRGAKAKIGPTWDAWIKSIGRFGTMDTRRAIGNARVKPMFADAEVRSIGSRQWRQWFERQAETCSDNYARNIRSAVQAFYGWCILNDVGGVVINPIDASTAFGRRAAGKDPNATLARLRNEREEESKRHLELDEIASFLAAYRSAYPQTYDLWLVMSACALRAHEAIGVEASAFDFRKPNAVRLAVHQGVKNGRLGPTKTNTKRWVDVPASIVPTVRSLIERAPEVIYRGEKYQFLFPPLGGTGRPRNPEYAPTISYDTLKGHIKAVKVLAGIRTANVAHMARHTAVLLAIQAPTAATSRAFGHTLTQHLAYGAAPKGIVGSAIDAQLAGMLPTGNVHVLKKPRVKPGVKKAGK